MKRLILLTVLSCTLGLISCKSHKLPAFANQHWHVDSYSGNAVNDSGLELSFGAEWMITDTSLIQNYSQLEVYPALSSYLAQGLAQFPEIEVDSVLFYNPHRNLLFVTYHQVKPLKPTSEICLYDGSGPVYSGEYAKLFGITTTYIDDSGWENGPEDSAYSNVRYKLHDKSLVHLLRFPGKENIAVFQISSTIPKRGKWWEDYPRGTFCNTDLGNLENIERIANSLHSSKNLAVKNLELLQTK